MDQPPKRLYSEISKKTEQTKSNKKPCLDSNAAQLKTTPNPEGEKTFDAERDQLIKKMAAKYMATAFNKSPAIPDITIESPKSSNKTEDSPPKQDLISLDPSKLMPINLTRSPKDNSPIAGQISTDQSTLTAGDSTQFPRDTDSIMRFVDASSSKSDKPLSTSGATSPESTSSNQGEFQEYAFPSSPEHVTFHEHREPSIADRKTVADILKPQEHTEIPHMPFKESYQKEEQIYKYHEKEHKDKNHPHMSLEDILKKEEESFKYYEKERKKKNLPLEPPGIVKRNPPPRLSKTNPIREEYKKMIEAYEQKLAKDEIDKYSLLTEEEKEFKKAVQEFEEITREFKKSQQKLIHSYEHEPWESYETMSEAFEKRLEKCRDLLTKCYRTAENKLKGQRDPERTRPDVVDQLGNYYQALKDLETSLKRRRELQKLLVDHYMDTKLRNQYKNDIQANISDINKNWKRVNKHNPPDTVAKVAFALDFVYPPKEARVSQIHPRDGKP